MKKRYFLLIFLALVVEVINAQTLKSDNKKKGIGDNYFSPFHKAINDSTQREISEIALFFGGGIGLETVGVGATLEYSIAYRSHVLNFSTFKGIGLPFDNLNRQISSYSCTFGESFRSNNSYFSISTGISFNSYFGSLPIPDGTFPFDYYKYEFKGENVISVPIEFRTNALAINGIGIGLYLNINLISKDEHTYFMYGGINLVLGYWNKTKRNSQIKQTHM